MPTFRVDKLHYRRQAGFTLLELIVVLAILALTSGALMYSSGSGLETARFRSFLVKTSGMLSEGRSIAIRDMTETVFVVDVRNRRLGYRGAQAMLQMPKDVELRAELAEGESRDDGTNGIRFYPTGSSSGGTLAFGYHGQDYEIRVNWLTGNVSTHRM